MQQHIDPTKITFGFPSKADSNELINLFCEITETIKSTKNWENYSVKADNDKQQMIIGMILDKDDKICIAKYGNEIVAAVNLEVIHNIRHGWQRGHIEELVVKKSYRRNGVGKMLLNFVIDYCKNNNIHVIKLLCGTQLKDSQAFYEKMGFKHTDMGYRIEI